MAMCMYSSCTAPSGAPETLTATAVFSTNITVQWNRVNCRERNSEITQFVLHYSLDKEPEEEPREVTVAGVSDQERMYTLTRLQPQSGYTVAVAAVNNGGQRGPNISITLTTSEPES